MKFARTSLLPVCAILFAFVIHGTGCSTNFRAQTGDKAVSGGEAATLAQASPPQPKQKVESPFPPPRGFVNDFANVFDSRTREQLEARLRRLQARAKVEIAVATVETTGQEDIFDYSLAVARGWGIGPPAGEAGGGLLLLLAIKDRKWQIQVSRSLEADLPNDVAARIGGRMTPWLREGKYGEAAVQCVDDLIKRLAERRGFEPDDALINEGRTEDEKPTAHPTPQPTARAHPTP